MDFVWDCVAEALAATTVTRPRDPQNIANGTDATCVYKVKCDMYDEFFGMVVKTDGFWYRNMHLPPGGRCSCPKYCQFQVIGMPQTITGSRSGQDINLFIPTSFRCGDSLRALGGI